MPRLLMPLLLVLAACGGQEAASPEPERSPSRSSSVETRTPSPSSTRPSSPSSPSSPSPSPTQVEKRDPRWRFFTDDRTRYSSPWFVGRHRVMIGYGCTEAPYYDPDPSCPGRQGFHHGVDVAIPCGVGLRAGADGEVLSPAAPGSPGPAYGERPFRIRSGDLDILIGHARRVFVASGDRVRTGQRIALVSDSAAPDGCHLHFEVRRAGQGVSGAIDPAPYLRLS